jgi:hypothetical protein
MRDDTCARRSLAYASIAWLHRALRTFDLCRQDFRRDPPTQRSARSLHARRAFLTCPLQHDELCGAARRVGDELDHQIDVANEEARLRFCQELQRVTAGRLGRRETASRRSLGWRAPRVRGRRPCPRTPAAAFEREASSRSEYGGRQAPRESHLTPLSRRGERDDRVDTGERQQHRDHSVHDLRRRTSSSEQSVLNFLPNTG